ncbi:molybdopterin-dependent oxidoreductase [Poseidonocella sp. HB161398]|uniref:molybdopterin-dependent oxidoreductase n=1 Tax=Poseidonocella sp. HB161398 TaxID=2320855 RepID=UPI001109B2F8|nr:molybdopterin-dependent oxidoreductase [Poseidonocella sp. HB161398]
MQTRPRVQRNMSHWGAFRAEVANGVLKSVAPFEHDPAPNPLIHAWPEMLTSPLRVAEPVVRRGWLDGDSGAGRGCDSYVAIPWDAALDRVAGEIGRVRDAHGNAAILGGSYGWSSAGRLHHARTLIRRFMNSVGGCTDQMNNYSYGAAMVFLPRILGRSDMIGSHLTSARSIAADCDVLLAFGGLPRRPWANQAGGAGEHGYDRFMEQVTQRARLVAVSPSRGDLDPDHPGNWIAIRPNTDTALILALCHRLLETGAEDRAFVDRYTSGSERFRAYLTGDTDGTPKDAGWAEAITGIPAAEIAALADALPGRRVLVTATWSLQRAHHGEQPYWAIVALAAMLGQIGLPGGGFAFGYGSSGGMGNPRYQPPLYSLPTGPNPAGSAIPVARVADALLCPGQTYRYDGTERTYPEIRMVYWAGGNPFMHHQDLNRLAKAFRRPETVVVQDCFWTATARHADIVLPATTTLERNDIGGSSRDPYLMAMHKLVEPVGAARNDFDIFADLAGRLGAREAFTDGLDETGLLARAWDSISQRLAARGITPPSFETFWDTGYLRMPEPVDDYVMLADFRADPDANRLATPSGRIELYSPALEAEGGGAHPGHPAWLEPAEWLGAPGAERFGLHLLTPQPQQRLHGQLDGATYVQGFKTHDREHLRLHPTDAARRGIADGDPVQLWNDRGSCHAVARLDPDLAPGVAVLPTGSSFDPDGRADRNSNPNVLTADIGSSDMTQGCAAQSCLVEIRRVDRLPELQAYRPPRIDPAPRPISDQI